MVVVAEGRLSIDVVQGGEVLVNMVSLFPAENGVEGSVSPFRTDLLDLLKGLQPRHTHYTSP